MDTLCCVRAGTDGSPLVHVDRRKTITRFQHSLTYQTVNVTSPLSSSSRTCDNQDFVVFHRDGGWVEDEWIGHGLQQGRRHLHNERMGLSTSASFQKLEHYAEKETESKIDVENGSIAEDDECDTDEEASRAPLRLKQVVGHTARERVDHDRLHVPYRS